jgi:serine/threonine-protein phosphatase 2A regulatory subunit B
MAKQQKQHKLDELPGTVLGHLFCFLDGPSLVALTSVSKTMHNKHKAQQNKAWRTILNVDSLPYLRDKDKVRFDGDEGPAFPSATATTAPTTPSNSNGSALPKVANKTGKNQGEGDLESLVIDWRDVYSDMQKHNKQKWKLNQVFGEDPSAVNEENVITTVEFDSTGEFLSIGYQCGQVVVFRNTAGDTYKFCTQFESHHPEFDFLTSLEIEEKINKIRWVGNKYANNVRMLLSTNDKTVKLWKMYEKKSRTVDMADMPISDRAPGAAQTVTTTVETKQRKVYANAHAYNINSISLCSDGELFISADDLRVNLWNLEISTEAFTVIDTKPTNMNELSEVITATEFHPSEPHSFVWSSSKGLVYLADMRRKSLCDKAVRSFKDKEKTKSFFSEVTSSISDVMYSKDGGYVLARDYLHLKLWDVRMEAAPVMVVNVHEHIRPKLYELYENDSIFDKFECSFSNNDLHLLSGSYSNNFMIYDIAKNEPKYLQAINPRERRRRRPSVSTSLPTTEDINFNEKVTHVAWHPRTDLVAIAAGNYIYLYHLAKP